MRLLVGLPAVLVEPLLLIRGLVVLAQLVEGPQLAAGELGRKLICLELLLDPLIL